MARLYNSVGEGLVSVLRYIVTVSKELQRCRVQAIPASRWRGAVWKDMALMTAAACAADLNASHSVAIISDLE
jgi:hypothetical protein